MEKIGYIEEVLRSFKRGEIDGETAVELIRRELSRD